MLIYDDTTFGIQRCQLNLEKLYPVVGERKKFLARLDDFMKSDDANPKIYFLQDASLVYRSEVFISSKIDPRPPLLLLLGNPASHSVSAGMCFSFEGAGREHRFWRVLEETGILTFLKQLPESADPVEKNDMRRDALLEHKYLSPFQVGIAPFYSMPSPASIPKWSGVSGIRRLLGAKAFGMLSFEEEKRITKLVSGFMRSTGGIIAFQKDVYNRVRSQQLPAYSLASANQGLLLGTYKGEEEVFLACSPPTRLALTAQSKFALLQLKKWLSQKLITNP